MEFIRLTSCLTADAARLAEVADGNMDAKVPTCPEWTVSDLVYHVALVYQHKVECIKHGRNPDPWPPESVKPPLTMMRTALGDLLAEFTARMPGDDAYTWYDPDQTVGFWIRRMAHETVIHRADAELAAGRPVGPIDAELALDGIDEFLMIFVDWSSKRWAGEVAEAIAKAATPEPITIHVDDRAWTVHVTESTVNVDDGDTADGTEVAKISGTAQEVLLWLWRRGESGTVTTTGDRAATERFREMLGAFAN